MSQPKKPKMDSMLMAILTKIETIQEDIKEIKTQIFQNNNSESTEKNLLLDQITNQNVSVSNILAEHTVALKSTITSLWQNPKHLERFPIPSEDALNEWESDIDEDNKCGMINAVKSLLGKGGLRKNLKLVLSPDLIFNYNLQGTHNKKRLYNFTKVMEILLRSTVNPGDPHSFENDMRKAIRDIKNRHFKDASTKKKDPNTPQVDQH